MTKEFILKTEEETLAFGRKLAEILPAGSFVALHGNLGAGKTVLVRGVASFLGIDHVSSPTFTIVQEYDTCPELLHFDVYRLSDADELYAIGFEDYLARNGIIIMEWSELVEDILPGDRLEMTILGEGNSERKLTVSADGGRAMETLLKL